MTGREKLRKRSDAERLQYQAEFENLAAAEVRRIVDAFIEDRGVTQTEIARSVGLDPSRLSKALYPSNLTLRTLSLIALACDQEWTLEALGLDEASRRRPSNYARQPMVGPDDTYGNAISIPAKDGTSKNPSFDSDTPLPAGQDWTFAEFRQ